LDKREDQRPSKFWTISEMAAEFKVTARTLQSYEIRRLLHPRREGTVRYYDEIDYLRMQMIVKGKQLGFSLKEIRDLIGNPEKDQSDNDKPVKTTSSDEEGVVLARVRTWAGGESEADFWYRSQPISAFGDRTAESLVKSGQSASLRDYLDAIALGGFA